MGVWGGGSSWIFLSFYVGIGSKGFIISSDRSMFLNCPYFFLFRQLFCLLACLG